MLSQWRAEAGQHNEANLSKAKAAVKEIVVGLETSFKSLNISDVIKGGSLGHGTVVPGHYDIDLVIYSRDVQPDEVLRLNGFQQWTEALKIFIKQMFGIVGNNPGKHHRAVRFEKITEGLKLRVDLLVSPYWQTPDEFYNYLRSIPKENHSMLTVCASRWQVNFFQSVDNQAKEYIRRAKAWRNKMWSDDKRGKPSSYLISLLVLKAYESAGQSTRPIDVTKALILLVKSPCLDVYWDNKYYRMADYRDLLPSSPPRVIDPANPANNVWESGFIPPGQCASFVSRIHSIDLSIPI